MSRLVGISILFVVFLAACARDVTGLYLVANEDIPVYAAEKEAMTSISSQVKLPATQRASVIECIDVKHYLIYKVRMPDGREGFVNNGKYSLERNGKPSYCS
ncbi:hypothetical protein [Undibacterium sp. TJN19]|uniref:hypothetical protein n=1 Tax=Undibacterium sp. TJN19 TaxID=3413055 RepID=UPI003BF30273